MKQLRLPLFITLIILLLIPSSALAQTYRFSVDELNVDVYWNEDGTSSINYTFIFTNDNSASPIDFVDVGLPNGNFDVGSIRAEVNGNPINYISRSDYQGSGSSGVAIGLEEHAIPPGRRGTVHVYIGTQRDVLYPDTEGDNYASGVFVPTWFGSKFVQGDTRMTVTFHLPPGVTPEQPRWHASPAGFPSAPETGIDEQGRVTYTWRNDQANAYSQYKFGASFPAQLVPESAIIRPSFLQTLGINPADFIGCTLCGGFFAFMAFIVWASVSSARRRKLQYLPPKISIEGHGIKRGLTSIEAAILLEQPMDKILTMILFAVIKKDAASVKQQDPLTLETAEPLPEGLREYEKKFLEAFAITNKGERRRALQNMMVGLVKSVANKMKGFSRAETVAYYKDIVKRAWAQVEASDTPEVRSEKYDEVMEWTMLDEDYDRRTRDVFRSGPVIVPMWWPRYDPGYRPSAPRPAASPSLPSSGGGKTSLPHLPGSDFAASMVTGIQNFSAGVIGNVTDFTSGITNKTNPPPPPSTSSSRGGFSGGGGCACACACAGCACACAGGGR